MSIFFRCLVWIKSKVKNKSVTFKVLRLCLECQKTLTYAILKLKKTVLIFNVVALTIHFKWFSFVFITTFRKKQHITCQFILLRSFKNFSTEYFHSRTLAKYRITQKLNTNRLSGFNKKSMLLGRDSCNTENTFAKSMIMGSWYIQVGCYIRMPLSPSQRCFEKEVSQNWISFEITTGLEDI